MERRKHHHQSGQPKVWVVAGSNICRGACYGPVTEIEFRFVDDRIMPQDEDTIVEIVAKDGLLMADIPDVAWVKHIPASRDVYEQNLEIYRSHGNQIFIRVTRDVVRGERLSCWYEELYSMEINVPYLTPLNIRGIEDYRCTACGEVFAYPNILKLHLMHSCRGIWPRDSCDTETHRRLRHLTPSPNCIYAGSDIKYSAKLIQGNLAHTNAQGNKTAQCTFLSPPVSQHLSDYDRESPITCNLLCGQGKTSLFSPYNLKASIAFIPTYNKPLRLGNQDAWVDVTSGGSDTMQLEADFRNVESQVSPLYLDGDEEPMEILHKSFIEFSTKKGHLCVYCGKFYSRKYGLKIHLRTHTGYKPLKCRICFRAFGDPSNLNKHTRLHAEGDTPYKCTECGKVLVRRRDLVRHLNSRHPDVRIKDETNMAD